ncbi:hypothetical protein [Achromobacter phage ehaak_LB5]|nr:hypothetical protein [Achromobacter phage ehaak_LB5]
MERGAHNTPLASPATPRARKDPINPPSFRLDQLQAPSGG